MDGFHTPKKVRINPKRASLLVQSNSPVLKITRRESCIPFTLKDKLKNNKSPIKECHSIKKPRRRNFSGETIYEEPENNRDNKKVKKNFCYCYSSFSGKTKKNEEIKNDYFINFTNNIYTKESHFEKNYIIRSPRKINNNSKINNYISAKTFFNSPKRRMSVMNSDFDFSNPNQRKFTENINLNFNKEGLTINSNYKPPFVNKKLFNKVDTLLHKDKLNKKESEFVLNYIEKRRDCESSPRHKISINNNNIISPRIKKKKSKNKNNKINKKNSVKFKEKNILEENVKNQTDKTENHQNNNNNINDTNNIILREIITDKPKFKWFNAFLCCFKKT